MREQVIIFGAGKWGKMAYYYYCDSAEILFFVDNDASLWGKKLLGKIIYPPAVIKDYDMNKIRLVVANDKHRSDIKKQIEKELGMMRCTSFSIVRDYWKNFVNSDVENKKIVRFSGRLGNQMFEYAFAEFLKSKGYDVLVDLDDCYASGGGGITVRVK